MRIVSGIHRGRRLGAPEGVKTRPTTDRVKEAMFNSLGSRFVIEGATFCDLYAGSGSLGLEAISRGAANVAFVERDRLALDALRANVDMLLVSDRSEVFASDALNWISTTQRNFDVILADPPYEFERWQDLGPAISARCRLAIVESDREIEAPIGSETVRCASYGTTVVTVWETTERDGGDEGQGRPK